MVPKTWIQKVHGNISLLYIQSYLQTREYSIDWRWPLSCVHSVMMVFMPSLLRVGFECPPPSLYIFTPFRSSYVAPLYPLPIAKLARYSYLHSSMSPLSPSLWSVLPFRQTKQAEERGGAVGGGVGGGSTNYSIPTAKHSWLMVKGIVAWVWCSPYRFIFSAPLWEFIQGRGICTQMIFLCIPHW